MELIYFINQELVGPSEAIANITRAIKLLEGRDFRVALISGEIGTQKRTVASILHHQSARRSKPMLQIDCSSISGPWIESVFELEGNNEILKQHKGVLCLQNIEYLSLKAQRNLLHLLEPSAQQSDAISLVALTRVDLKRAVKESKFLLELYEYLSRFHIHMPSLKERINDFPALAKKILKDLSLTLNTKMIQYEPEVMEVCSKYEWPGNLRQFQGMFEQVALYYPQENTFKAEFIPHYLRSAMPAKVINVAEDMKLPRQGVVLEDLERNLLKQALEQTLGNQSRAARLLGISRFALRYRMEKYGLFPKTKEEIMTAAANEWSE